MSSSPVVICRTQQYGGKITLPGPLLRLSDVDSSGIICLYSDIIKIYSKLSLNALWVSSN